MVRTTDNKLIIEMPSHSPADDLQSLQKEIIGAIQQFNYKDFGNTEGCPFFSLLELLSETLPTYHQTKLYLGATHRVNEPAQNKTEFYEWLQQQMERIKKENQ